MLAGSRRNYERQAVSREFEIEAVKQVTERGHAATKVAARLGVSSHSVYQWIERDSAAPAERQKVGDQQAGMKRLKAELKRVTEERDILENRPTAARGASVLAERSMKNQSRLLPIPAHSTLGYLAHFGNLAKGKTAKKLQFDQFGKSRIDLG